MRTSAIWRAGAAAAMMGMGGWANAAPPPSAPPYSLPWLLRPMTAATVVRLDETVAFSDVPSTEASARTAVTSLTATWKLRPRWVPVFRQTWVHQRTSTGAPPAGSAFSNPLLGISYVRPVRGPWRASAFLASTVPLGSGGGDRPDAAAAAAIAAAVPARSAMDNALFAVNYWTLIGGVGVARVTPGLTLQAEATVLQLDRVRGAATQDGHRTNLTAGVHAGRFFSPRVSLGAEVRLQRWMTDAAPVRSDPLAREQLTFAVGPRLHFKVGKRWLRPGLSYSRALDRPMRSRGYDVVQADLPVAF
jgi:hypothetical protein